MYILGAFGSIIRQELIIHRKIEKKEKKEKKCFVHKTSATAYADVFLLHYTIPSIFIKEVCKKSLNRKTVKTGCVLGLA